MLDRACAGWESSQPTLLGSELQAGFIELKTGIATLAFKSGADLTLEAPAKVELISAMEIKVISGSISMYVRESAQGFRVNTPNGYAIDHGTRFSVSISDDKSRLNSRFRKARFLCTMSRERLNISKIKKPQKWIRTH